MEQRLRQLSKWGKVIGWVSFIGGIIYALVSILTIIGIIPGIISAILGWKLIKASEHAERLAEDPLNERAMYDMIDSYATYFKIQGIFLIVTLVFVVLVIIFFVALGATLISHMPSSLANLH